MAISYIYSGQPMNGTEDDDFFIAYKGSTGADNNTVFGNGGDDLVVGDSSDTWIPNSSYLNGSIAAAFNLETLTSTWTTAENPMFGNSSIPHTTAMVETTVGQSEFFRVSVGAGQQITVDIDFGDNTSIGISRDLVVELQDSLGNILATADDSLVTDGGRGSFPSSPGGLSSHDPYLVFTVPTSGIYYINVRPFGGGPTGTFTDNTTFLMNVSVTGHATAAANPVQGADIIDGGAGDDALFGQGGGDTIDGGAGNDLIDGGSGGDIIHGGDGNDVIYGGEGTEENAHGDGGNDILHSGGEGHYYGDAGNDLVYAGLTSGINEVLDGGSGIDTVDTTSWNGTYVVDLAAGTTNFGEFFTNFENAVTGNGDDTVTGTAGANRIETSGGTDTVDAGAGNDDLKGGAGNDVLNGGTGSDWADYGDKTQVVSVVLAGAAATAVSVGGVAEDTISDIENLRGGSGNDLLVGDGLANSFYGGFGADQLFGQGGNDILRGDGGNDVLDGGAGSDTADYRDKAASVVVTLAGASDAAVKVGGVVEDTIRNVERVAGGNGNDTLNGDSAVNVLYGNGGNDLLKGAGGNDVLDGGAGSDTADYRDKAASVVVTLAGAADATVKVGGVAEDTIRNIERVAGGNGNDMLNGDSAVNVLYGNGGNDLLKGAGGNDVLDGGASSDTADYRDKTASVVVILGGASDATVKVGGVAEDTIRNIERVAGGGGNDALWGDGLVNVLYGNAGNDQLRGGGGNDVLDGGTGSDTADYRDKAAAVAVALNGAADATVLVGGVAEDTIRNIERLAGGSGNDALWGDGMVNLLYGNGGNDTLNGRAGNDVLNGGAGNDVFAFSTALGASNIDTIMDYSVANDTIRLENTIFSAIAGTGTLTAAQFAANAGGTAQDASDRIIYETDTGKLFYDGNGSAAGGSVQFAVLDPGLAVTNADFLIV